MKTVIEILIMAPAGCGKSRLGMKIAEFLKTQHGMDVDATRLARRNSSWERDQMMSEPLPDGVSQTSTVVVHEVATETLLRPE